MKACVWLMFVPCSILAQVKDDVQFETVAENQIVAADTEDDNTASMENFTQLLVHRLDLNSSNREQLRLVGLTEHQIANLIQHREINGKLLSVYELQSIEGFDLEFIRQLQKLVTVKDPNSTLDSDFLKRVKSDGYNYALLRTDINLEKRKGFSESAVEEQRFQGHQPRLSFRLRSFRAGDFSFGITAENDPGEVFKWKPTVSQYGFDYLAVHAQVQNKGFIRNLIIGDYQAQFGQGLVWGGAMSFGKGAETITNVRRNNVGFVPYTSAYEGGNLHGTAASLKVNKRITANILLSSNKRDASLDLNKEGQFISSLQNSGLHRNKNELEKRKVATQTMAGAIIEYNHKNLLLGSALQLMELDLALTPRKSLYNQFAFSGSRNTNVSVFANHGLNNISFFSEAALSLKRGNAFVIGSLISLTPKFDLSVLYRNYKKNYLPFFANAFSENTVPSNEKGFYWGMKYKFNRKFYLTGYVDFFSFPWLKYRTYTPVNGYEWLLHVRWQPVRNTNLSFQVRQENKYRNGSPGTSPLYMLNAISKNSYWIHADYFLTPNLRMKTRIQWSSFYTEKNVSEGFTIAQDISATMGKIKITGRYALFDTDNYDNRQYVYENDVWLAYSLPAYDGKGVRKYLLLQYKMNKTFTFWMRYSRTSYINKQSIGSGVETIDGNQQNDVKFVVRIQF
jgi:Helix-hairpin-helix motif